MCVETTLNELRYKEVISVTDGSRYGYVGDILLELDTGQLRGLIVPGQSRWFGLFGHREDRIIRWDHVRRFGEDIILVEGEPELRAPKQRKFRLF